MHAPRRRQQAGTAVSASFGKRLSREIAGSPKKAAALGALLLVALWFWAPLIKGWMAPASLAAAGAADTSSGRTAASAGPAPAQPAAVPPASPSGGAAPASSDTAQAFPNGYTWQQVAAAIDADPLMQPAGPIADRNDIFAVAPPAAVAAPAEAPSEPPPIKLSPSDAGLVLSSTVMGPAGRVALISGRRYRVGDDVKSTKDGQPIVFKLITVEPRQVVLETDGDRYLVKMPGARLSGDDSVE